MKSHWPRLLHLAQAEVEATLRELPRALQTPARKLPVVYEPRPNKDLTDDGLDPDVLGLFIGEPRAHEEDGAGGLPPQSRSGSLEFGVLKLELPLSFEL